jgi:transcriptional regulator with XRE-family HTH domain
MEQTTTSLDDRPLSEAVDASAVGRRIVEARHQAGWMTQQTLAELLCICTRSVQAYESGKRVPYRHLQRLGEIFERPASWFLHGGPVEDAASDPGDEVLERLDAQAALLNRLAVEVAALRRSIDRPSTKR